MGFVEWLELAADFSVRSLQNWQYSMNSIHYLLAMWSRFVSAVPYLPQDAQRTSQALRKCCLSVVESYVRIMLDSVDVVVQSEGAVEDPLDDEGSLKEQLDKLPGIARLQYDAFAQYLKGAFDTYFAQYERLLGNPNPPPYQMAAMEGRMTWIVYMIGGVINIQSSDPRAGKADLIWDGQLCKCVFQLLHVLEYRMSSSHGAQKCSSKLEMALLFFFQAFRKSYLMVDTMMHAISVVPTATINAGSTPAAHPLLAMALASSSSSSDVSGYGMDGMDKSSSEPSSIYEAMDIGDMTQLMNIIINKLCSNIKYWNRANDILEFTLEIFIEFINSYNATKTLLGLESINFLIRNHTGTHFPFLGYDNDNKYRIVFYTSLSRLVFSAAEDSNNSFDVFIEPMEGILRQLSITPELRDNNVKVAIIGILRDLRGVVDSTHNKRTYNLFFDALFPLLFPLLTRITDTWYDDEKVMTALLKFMMVSAACVGVVIVLNVLLHRSLCVIKGSG